MLEQNICIDSSKFKVEEKRQAVSIIISPSYSNLIMDCYFVKHKFVIKFMMDEIYLSESSKQAAIRLLKKRGFSPNNILYIGNVFVSNDVFEEVHVYFCDVSECGVSSGYVLMSCEDLSQGIYTGMVDDDLTKAVFYRYINYFGFKYKED